MIYDSTQAHARKAKATSRQSWCPGALPAGAGFAGFGAFPSKAPTNKLALASGIEEGDESSTDWDGDDSEKRKSSDSSMSLCSASGDATAAAAAAAAEIERLNGEKLELGPDGERPLRYDDVRTIHAPAPFASDRAH